MEMMSAKDFMKEAETLFANGLACEPLQRAYLGVLRQLGGAKRNTSNYNELLSELKALHSELVAGHCGIPVQQ